MTERERAFVLNGVRAFLVSHGIPALVADANVLLVAEQFGVSIDVLSQTREETKAFLTIAGLNIGIAR